MLISVRTLIIKIKKLNLNKLRAKNELKDIFQCIVEGNYVASSSGHHSPHICYL